MQRFLLLLLAFSGLYMALRRLFRPPQEGGRDAGAQAPPPGAPSPTVRDPVCGTFLTREGAIRLRSGGESHYFCSEECREKYLSRRG